ncbi:ion channel [uncultured Deefgea sp.]|uniref:ion channel n=1 Tax=uncultured Deefgea sp. TaxID=1304914 RepID=UPI0026254178|nr:ion channel [uncultured Deefgea sp.]
MIYLICGFLLVVATVLIHVLGIFLITFVEKFLIQQFASSIMVEAILFAIVTYLLMVVHLVSIFLWAFVYVEIGAMHNFSDAFFYSISSYSTVGFYAEGPAGPIGRLSGAFESCVGMVMFGLSASYLFGIRGKLNANALAKQTST